MDNSHKGVFVCIISALAFGIISNSTSTLAQNYVNPLSLIGRSNINPDLQGRQSNSALLRELAIQQQRSNLQRQRLEYERRLHRQNLDRELEIEKEKTRQLELQLKQNDSVNKRYTNSKELDYDIWFK